MISTRIKSYTFASREKSTHKAKLAKEYAFAVGFPKKGKATRGKIRVEQLEDFNLFWVDLDTLLISAKRLTVGTKSS